MMDVLCVGAHPDDVEIGMGATVAGMVRRGLDVALVDLTDGEPTPYGTREVRAREATDAARVLGVRRRETLDLPNRELVDAVEARKKLAEVVRRSRPRILFVPFGHDAHPDHVAAAAIGEAARLYAKFTKTDMDGEPHYPPRLYHYYAVHLRAAQVPSFVVDVTEDMSVKLDALACYRSQFDANPANREMVDVIATQGRYWGSLIGADFGEPFFSREEIGVSCVTDLL